MKSIPHIIEDIYSKCRYRRHLDETEYPNKDICEKCKGIGEVIIDGVEELCWVNKEGDCCVEVLDKEQFADEIVILMQSLDTIYKNQIIEAYLAGTKQFDNSALIVYPKTPEDYYNETYEK